MDVHELERSSENPRASSNHAESNDGTKAHGKSKSSWGLSTAVHSVGFVAKKVVNNRLTDSLWHSKKSSSSSSVPSDTSSLSQNAKRENQSREDVDHHTSKQSLNVAKEENESENSSGKGTSVLDQSENSKPSDNLNVSKSGTNVIDRSENLKPSDGSNVSTTGTNVHEESENLKPQNGSNVRLVGQHRWPSSTGSNVVDHLGSSKPHDSSHVRLVNQHRWPSTTGSNVVDQSENSKPPDGSSGRLVNQHLWPSTVGSNVLNKNSNHQDEAVRAANLTRTSLQNYASKQESSSDATNSLSSSLVNSGRFKIDKSTETQPSSPNKSYSLSSRSIDPPQAKEVNPSLTVPGVNPSPAPRGTSLTPAKRINPFRLVRGVSLTPASKGGNLTPSTRGTSPTRATRGVSPTPATRGVSPTPATRRVDPPPMSVSVSGEVDPKEVDPPPSSKEVGPSSAPRVVDPSPTVRGSSPMPPVRGVSPAPTTRPSSPPFDFHTPLRPSSPTQSYNSDTVSISTETDPSPDQEIGLTSTRRTSPSPSDRATSPSPSDRATSPTHSAREVSPTHTRGVGHRVKSVNPLKISGTRHFFKSNILSIFTKITDTKKEKNVANHIDDFKYLELLHNIQVQWQFANASAEAALDLQRVTAEKSLFDVWKTILELRDSIAAKKVDIDLLILQLKLYAVLCRQMTYIDEWASIQREYESALSITTNDLQARSLSVPIIGGVKADIDALKLVVFSTVQVLQTTVSCIHSTISKLDKTHYLASELANVALHERALLDECEIFLASAAPLHIEECSLRSYLIQLNRTSMTE